MIFGVKYIRKFKGTHLEASHFIHSSLYVNPYFSRIYVYVKYYCELASGIMSCNCCTGMHKERTCPNLAIGSNRSLNMERFNEGVSVVCQREMR
jgi:hypothetical protein